MELLGLDLAKRGDVGLIQSAFQAAFGAFITTYAVFAQERLGWTTVEIGIVFSAFGLGSILLGPILANLADRRGRRDVAVLGAVLAGAGVTAVEASYLALLADATDGGRRGRTYGWISALTSLGIVVGATGAAQIWEQTGDVGLGMLMAAVALAVLVGGLLLYPRDRPAET